MQYSIKVRTRLSTADVTLEIHCSTDCHVADTCSDSRQWRTRRRHCQTCHMFNILLLVHRARRVHAPWHITLCCRLQPTLSLRSSDKTPTYVSYAMRH